MAKRQEPMIAPILSVLIGMNWNVFMICFSRLDEASVPRVMHQDACPPDTMLRGNTRVFL
jgi:hypothetical protein